MGTRPGALDPGVVLYLFQGLGLTAAEVEAILYKKSGLLGISGTSNDMRDLLAAATTRRPGSPSTTSSTRRPSRSARSPRCSAGSTGSCSPAGIGENSPEIRRRIGEACAWLGVELDPEANAAKGPRISTAGEPGLGVGRPDERGADDRPAHRAAAGTGRGPRVTGPGSEERGDDGNDRTQKTKTAAPEPPWRGFRARSLAEADRRPRLHPAELRAVRGRRIVPRPGDARAREEIWDRLNELFVEERKKGVLDVSQIPSSITAHAPGYIDRENEIIVGLQTEAPLKRAIMPNGGFRMVLGALKAYGYEPDPHVVEAFTKYRKTHNEAVFDAYTADIRKCRSSHILTGLPDAYGRGRIIGDYRRVALYGVDRLIEREAAGEDAPSTRAMSTDEIIRDREELSEQIRALKELQQMAASYGFDISGPAAQRAEAVQWLYFGYLAAVKEQNGAAMSLGRTSTFLDVYFERDLAAGVLTEEQAQEIVDDFVIKLRIVRFLRTPEYDELFAGDPTWVTESIGGHGRRRPAAGDARRASASCRRSTTSARRRSRT